MQIAVLVLLIGAVSTKVVLGTPRPGTRVVTVSAGSTLWQIAAQRYSQTDPRAVVAAIEQANHLKGAVIFPGERLVLPPV